ncbi:hypothetical protein A7E78_03795 [Syntrophotalea acetylenivorans]|uniref:Recombinase-like domain-containing protein n=1 Tax=Syntrophotalea acetylenivorans TaxID=1842532 RepID=A0A1L3GMB2_9BACT|nr:recombinase-like helix-turn-helix domain-containing protein [Syntrophotalea acetylenivorans]APG27030.1 hypothetical protein A7E78_03795 [Syntrophotalea acetylenivorans]
MDRSRKIKEGLERARQKGVKLGNPTLEVSRNSDLTNANKARQEKADRFALQMLKPLKDIYKAGYNSVGEVVQELNRMGIEARQGGKWTRTQYNRLTDRLAKFDRDELNDIVKSLGIDEDE